ncbi:MAG: nitroreductase family protein [Clostridia bacterium]|nr:nitroreductase family protein [Clostridia bacterium]
MYANIRKFDSKKIDELIIEEILYYASLAPLGKNRQPWRFVVIQEDTELKNKIADIMIKKAEEKIKNGENAGSIKNTTKVMKEAPVFNTWNNKIINSKEKPDARPRLDYKQISIMEIRLWIIKY